MNNRLLRTPSAGRTARRLVALVAVFCLGVAPGCGAGRRDAVDPGPPWTYRSDVDVEITLPSGEWTKLETDPAKTAKVVFERKRPAMRVTLLSANGARRNMDEAIRIYDGELKRAEYPAESTAVREGTTASGSAYRLTTAVVRDTRKGKRVLTVASHAFLEKKGAIAMVHFQVFLDGPEASGDDGRRKEYQDLAEGICLSVR